MQFLHLMMSLNESCIRQNIKILTRCLTMFPKDQSMIEVLLNNI